MMHTEKVTINGRELDYTYSDAFYIERDGVEYPDALDPIGSGRVYTETERPLPVEDPETEPIEDTVDEEATVDDYIAALTDLGVISNEEE